MKNDVPDSDSLQMENVHEVVPDECEFSRLLNECIYEELKDCIYNNDPHALAILVNAKSRLKKRISNVKETIKYVALMLKPFYLVCVISVLTQKPDNI